MKESKRNEMLILAKYRKHLFLSNASFLTARKGFIREIEENLNAAKMFYLQNNMIKSL